LDHSSYAAIKRNLVTTALANIKNEKLKGKKVKIEVAS
jgi:DbpA RNA binding domain